MFQEAHAVDEWPISSSKWTPDDTIVAVPQHKSIEDRVAAAASFLKMFPMDGTLYIQYNIRQLQYKTNLYFAVGNDVTSSTS